MNRKEEKEKIIDGARRLGIANERAIRNINIRDEFFEIRKNGRMKYRETISFLADKYFLSCGSVLSVIYPKYIKKT